MRRLLPLFVLPLLVACRAEEGPTGTAEQAITVCPGPTTLPGVDVSHWDGTIDWATAAGSGIAFGFAKATESTSFIDPEFANNWQGMKDAGVVRGAYHFFHATDDPIASAQHLLDVMGPLEPGDLPPTLDLESSDGQSGATVAANTATWLQYVADQTGTTPILYVSPSFLDGIGNPSEIGPLATLWVAHWNVACPSVVTPFSTWAFWQTGSGSVPGIPGTADTNEFNGSLADLQALTVPAPSTTGAGGGGAGGGSAGPTGSGTTSSGSGTFGSGGGSGTGVVATSGSSDGGAMQPCTTGGCSLAASDDAAPSKLAWLVGAVSLALVALRRRRRA